MVRTTRVSSKGQVVIPAWIRRRINLTAGETLRVELAGDGEPAIVLRRRYSPKELDGLLQKGYEWFRRTGYDPVQALHDARKKERAGERKRRQRRSA